MKSGRKWIAVGVALLVSTILVGAMMWSGTGFRKAEKITLGTARLESSALIYIAEQRGFFARNGLDLTVREFDTGLASLNGLLKGEVDIATPAEYALVGKAFEKEDVRAIAAIDEAQYFFVIGRRDSGVQKAADLKGKRIAVVGKTIGEFYLGRFLQLNGIDPDDVDPVYIDIADSEDVITRGDVDAIMCRSPYASAIQKRLGTNAVVWPAQSSQALYAVLVAKGEWLKTHHETARRLLAALLQAEDYLVHHPEQAKSIVQKRLNLNESELSALWSQNQFSLSLDQALVLAMEDEARWMMENGVTKEKIIPDFADYIHTDALEDVKPEAVNIIR